MVHFYDVYTSGTSADYTLSPLRLRTPYRRPQRDKTRINQAIRAPEIRVIGPQGENYGVITPAEALKHAETHQLDLIEISPNAKPPVCKIMDYGKYRYESGRKARAVKAKSHTTETKTIQVKIGTGEHDQQLKAKRIAEWLEEGHRVKVDLFLWGRYKYMDATFLKERLSRFLKIIPAEYKIADEMKRGPKGFTTTIERSATQQQRPAPKPAEKAAKPKAAPSAAADDSVEPGDKRKKKDLDDLLETGMV